MTTKKLLIVDDDKTFANILQRSMQDHYSQVSCCYTNQQAEKLIGEQVFDDAIVDLHIDNDSGLDLIPILLQGLPELRIVVLTGYSSIASCVSAMKLGAYNYLCKPVGSDDIINAFNHSSNIELDSNPPSVERLEWEHIQKTLQEQSGNISATARVLGMHRRTLQRKLQKRPVKS